VIRIDVLIKWGPGTQSGEESGFVHSFMYHLG
jgi:hypothetical protein